MKMPSITKRVLPFLLTLIAGIFFGSLFILSKKDESDFLPPPVPMTHSDVKAKGYEISHAGDFPYITSLPKAEYPLEAYEKRVEGDVILEVQLKSDSTVGDIKVLKAQQFGMTEAAVEAAKKIRFIPAFSRQDICSPKSKGKFYTFRQQITYKFNLITAE